MTVQYRITRILSTLLLAGLCSAPLLRAQQTNPATPQQAPETSQQPQQPDDTSPRRPLTRSTQPVQRSLVLRSQLPAASRGSGTEHAARGAGKPESAAAAGAVRDKVNPSQAPLNPVTTYPDASDTQQHAAIVQCCACCASDHDYDSRSAAAQDAD